ncbi:GNAT family N-acetyltransferase [Azospirillum doebereinerae]|uniref:GNAT family N-acetyltransferase n=1 Tax=Azospirillum doebereinerae TaxID=92933 RepID=A0A3S0WY41_9PROT|nr:GNAT family N-acetyltransferase [Azospirillum doebereinerae]RUQ75706.1 GNAT family N-acetyltransferase [Azospirillum doebereinerae]
MSDQSITLSVTDSASPTDAERVLQGLKTYNEASVERAFDRRDVTVLAHDAEGTLLGGLTGYTLWEWLYVDHLWVGEGGRRGGLGSRLLDAAEAEAKARGCRWSRLYTYDFQAPGFYPKRGYEVWAEMEGYPEGHKQIWFRKTLG